MESSMPLSEYANKLIGVDSALIEGKLTLRTPSTRLFTTSGINRPSILLGFGNKLLRAAFRSLQAYNQMVSGFIASVQGRTKTVGGPGPHFCGGPGTTFFGGPFPIPIGLTNYNIIN